jgi:predicted outer membrane repeat protein
MRWLALAVSLLLASPPAFAAGVVTRCSVDVDPAASPTDPDLSRALIGGGNVSFACPPGTVIRMTQGHSLTLATAIDGGGHVVLDAHGVTAMFAATGDWTLFLSRITLRHGASSFGFHGNGLAFGGLLFGPIRLVMTDVNVEDTRSPIAVASADIRGGRFSGNTGTVVRARNILITAKTEFSSNPTAVPFAPPSVGGELEMGETATVEDATFNGNLGATWRGPIVIKRSSFVNNGADQVQGGALWIDGEARIEKTEFINNRASDGGAIFLRRGSLDVRRGRFRGNRAQLSGGAIYIGAQSTTQGAELRLSYSHLDGNMAANGGAIRLVQGSYTPNRLLGKLVKFGGNAASQSGGAISSGDARIELSRTVFVENSAGSTGGAISFNGLRFDSTRLGNVLMVRNKAAIAGGYYGSRLEAVNSTIADNVGGAFRMTLPTFPLMSHHQSELRLLNTIVSNNDTNCPPPQDQVALSGNGMNIQFPGSHCGATASSVNPYLDAMYVPTVGSPARHAGDTAVCVNHDLVQGKDVYGESRETGKRCTVGAVERDLERHAVKALQRNHEQRSTLLGQYLAILGLKRYALPGGVEKAK